MHTIIPLRKHVSSLYTAKSYGLFEPRSNSPRFYLKKKKTRQSKHLVTLWEASRLAIKQELPYARQAFPLFDWRWNLCGPGCPI
jgi:hypothetical protein